MVGAIVRHAKYGEGTITKEEDGNVYIDFSIGEKVFPYRTLTKFVTCDDPAIQEEYLKKAAMQTTEKEKAAEAKKEEIKELVQKISEKKSERRSSDSKKYPSWIKFEGPQNERQPHEMVSVEDDGKTLYILNYVKKPSGVNDGDTVFMAAGIVDEDGNSQQAIIGRGTLCRFKDINEVKPAWIYKYDWMNHYKYYLVLKEFEVLDSARKDGLLLDRVLNAVGADTYPSSEGQDISLEKLRGKHTQKMHMMITNKATQFINDELDKLFEIYGSREYRSEL